MRVGEQSAWYWLYRRPEFASESMAGMGSGPPKALRLPENPCRR
jgi:hypothetical protein